MPETIDINDIINRNPKVNAQDLAAINEMLERLAKMGIEPERYSLLAPFSQRKFFKKNEPIRPPSPLRFKR